MSDEIISIDQKKLEKLLENFRTDINGCYKNFLENLAKERFTCGVDEKFIGRIINEFALFTSQNIFNMSISFCKFKNKNDAIKSVDFFKKYLFEKIDRFCNILLKNLIFLDELI